MLKEIGTYFTSQCSPYDTPVRWGGEEFAIILPGADIDVAMQIGERVRAAVAGLALPHEQGPFGIVTVSVGIASLIPPADGDPALLLTLADEALYQAKSEGRNRVCASTRSA